MGSLKVRKVIYNGDIYYFESPYFSDGLQIIEAENGSGKTTFSSLISFALGIYVPKFNFSNRKEEHHKEIKEDTNNYVLVDIEIENEMYTLKRFFGDNSNLILVQSSLGTESYDVNRREGNEIFSDWLLEKLGIPIFNIYQGSKSFTINFWDLSRLIYYDQSSSVHKIFKEHRSSNNFISDSALVRQTIFQVLLGKGFATYHKKIGEYNLLTKEKDSLLLAVKSLKDTYRKIGINVESFRKEELLKEYEELQLREKRLALYKLSIAQKSEGIDEVNKHLNELKSEFNRSKKFSISYEGQYDSLLRELNDLQGLKETLIDEIDQIEKILLTHDRLMLFSVNTCPCCLKEIDRQKNRCICGTEIEENEYEKFFYTTDEYLQILKSKKKSITTIDNAIESCQEEIVNTKSNINILNEEVKELIEKINRFETSDSNVIDSEYLEANDKIYEIKSRISSIEKNMDFFEQFDILKQSFESKEREVKKKQEELQLLEENIHGEFSSQVEIFKSIYEGSLLSIEDSIEKVDLNDDYLPIINNGIYKEASLAVLRKLTYYITLLLMSIKNKDVLFPSFLIIDTPESLGIDDDKLNKGIGLINLVYLEIGKIAENKEKDVPNFQVILTTGEKKYPPFYSKYVVMHMEKEDKLLKKK